MNAHCRDIINMALLRGGGNNPDWFYTKQIRDGLWLTVEQHFFEGNRCNIWLIQGPEKDIIIDTGKITL